MWETSTTRPILGDAPDGINTAGDGSPIRCVAYLDSVEISLARRHMPRLKDFKTLGMMISTCKNRHNQVCGFLCMIHQPNIPTLQKLDVLTRQYQGVITRSDIALDFSTPEPQKLHQFIQQHGLLKWRPKQPMHDEEEGTYWCQLKTGQKRYSARNLVVYSGRHNKITGETKCVHFELKLLRPHMVRRNGIHNVSDLITLNPSTLFNRHIKFSDIATKVMNEIVRKEVSKDLERYRGRDSNKYVDRYRAGIKRRVKYLLRSIQFDRAQVVHDAFPKRLVTPMTVNLNIAETLSWRDDGDANGDDSRQQNTAIQYLSFIENIEESQKTGGSDVFNIRTSVKDVR